MKSNGSLKPKTGKRSPHELPRVCVFCGSNEKRSHTDEHIVPEWLIRLTNTESKKIKLPRGNSAYFKSLVLPACEICNRFWGKALEEQAKSTVTKIINSIPVTAIEIDSLLDWFDKVRIGLWLAQLYYANNELKVRPKFLINSRMGMCDRLINIVRISQNNHDLSWYGTDSKSFITTPSCFSLLINDFLFINLSSDNLFHDVFGLPQFSQAIMLDDNGRYEPLLEKGVEYIDPAPLNKYSLPENSKILAQALYKSALDLAEDSYNSEHVRTTSLSKATGRSKILSLEAKASDFELIDHDQLIQAAPTDMQMGISPTETTKIIQDEHSLSIESLYEKSISISDYIKDRQNELSSHSASSKQLIAALIFERYNKKNEAENTYREIYHESNDIFLVDRAHQFFLKNNFHEDAIKSVDKMLALTKGMASQEEMLAIAYGNKGLILSRVGNLHAALTYYKRSLQVNKNIGRNGGAAKQYGNIGSTYARLGDFGKAFTYLNESLKLHLKMRDARGTAIQLYEIGRLYLSQDNFGRAKKYMLKSLRYDSDASAHNVYFTLGKISEVEQDHSMASSYFEQCYSRRQFTTGETEAQQALDAWSASSKKLMEKSVQPK